MDNKQVDADLANILKEIELKTAIRKKKPSPVLAQASPQFQQQFDFPTNDDMRNCGCYKRDVDHGHYDDDNISATAETCDSPVTTLYEESTTSTFNELLTPEEIRQKTELKIVIRTFLEKMARSDIDVDVKIADFSKLIYEKTKLFNEKKIERIDKDSERIIKGNDIEMYKEFVSMFGNENTFDLASKIKFNYYCKIFNTRPENISSL